MENDYLHKQFGDLIISSSADEIKEMFENAQALMTYYRCALLEVETKFKVLNEQFSLQHERNPIENIKTRLKSFGSIQEKMFRKNFPLSLESMEENMHDIAGIRVICGFIDDIYMLADCLIQQDDIRLIEIKDYIKNPKPNGYRSLHLIVEIPIFLADEKKFIKVEVQLRTIAMESWANLEHRLRYKKNLPEGILKQTAHILNECADLSNTLDIRMQYVRDIVEEKADD
ncbi:MAG: GTP pyrophosphokinase family protein [Lachnospiraceae bacterium]